MCGRYALHGPKSRRRTARPYLDALDEYAPRYNVAPTQVMPIVRMADGCPHVVPARWGLVPSWAQDMNIGFKTFNARAETVATKPAFRDAYRRRRCLVPASGYYEWQSRAHVKQPYYFTVGHDALFAFAGLWDEWMPADADPVATYTIIVCAPNVLAREVHDRMPVILRDEDWERWLHGSDPGSLLKPYAATDLQRHPVSTRVNDAANDDISLIDPLDEASTLSPQMDLWGN